MDRLVVENIGVEDDGVYTITASNSVGETIATAKLVCHSKNQFGLYFVCFFLDQSHQRWCFF